MERDNLEELGGEGRIIIIKWNFSKWSGEARTGLL
jgi:hypothetical protein